MHLIGAAITEEGANFGVVVVLYVGDHYGFFAARVRHGMSVEAFGLQEGKDALCQGVIYGCPGSSHTLSYVEPKEGSLEFPREISRSSIRVKHHVIRNDLYFSSWQR